MDRNYGTLADAARRTVGRPSVDEIVGELRDNGLVGIAEDAGGGITAVVVRGRDGLVAVTRDAENEYTVGMYHGDAWDGGEPTHFWTGVTLADVGELTRGTMELLDPQACEVCGEPAVDRVRDENGGGPWVAVCDACEESGAWFTREHEIGDQA